MCTAATYNTKSFFFGRNLDYEFSYGEEVVVTPRNYPFSFTHFGTGGSPRLKSVCLKSSYGPS